MSLINVSSYVAQKIKYYRKLKRITQKELGEKIGVKHNTISSYENGINQPEQDLLFKIADALDVSINDLFPPTNYEPTNMKPATSDDMVRIPVIGTIACGDPILADENIIGYRYHLKDRLPKGQTFYLTAKGDSMEPKIPNGSDVLIRLQEDVEDGEIAAVLVNGDTEATLKRVKKQGDIVMLVAENNAYAPYIVTEHNPARILGKAVGVSFDL